MAAKSGERLILDPFGFLRMHAFNDGESIA